MCQHHPQRAGPGGQMSPPRGLGGRRQRNLPRQSCHRKGNHSEGTFLPWALPSGPHVWPQGATSPLCHPRGLSAPREPRAGQSLPPAAKPGAHPASHPALPAVRHGSPGSPQPPALPSLPGGLPPLRSLPGAPPAALPRGHRPVWGSRPLRDRSGAAPRWHLPGVAAGSPERRPRRHWLIQRRPRRRLSVRLSVRPPARPARCRCRWRGRPYRGAPALSGRSAGARGAAGAGRGAPSSRASPALPPALTSRLCN